MFDSVNYVTITYNFFPVMTILYITLQKLVNGFNKIISSNYQWSKKFYAQSILSHAGNKFRCYEVEVEESEKASSRRESNPGI